ncbi:MAG: hypothetical protein EPO09_14200 [Aquabacterium sp.]|uniref:hypothetical protein n=1 Tax=Aquabacterium sp. TaxID=1872578 RepID=UPI00121FA605|nr:hypothetical protein [Aquabacterium sp.]TAK92954.1 MAG: hypothetical protein EPO09_14200 [Aquabacterium sp.]
MPGSMPHTTSIRKRLRYLTTLACALTALTAVGILASGHVIHGALLMLGAMLLLPGSIFGRRHRQHLSEAALASSTPAPPRRWRKAA